MGAVIIQVKTYKIENEKKMDGGDVKHSPSDVAPLSRAPMQCSSEQQTQLDSVTWTSEATYKGDEGYWNQPYFV